MRSKLLFFEDKESDEYRAMIKKCVGLYDKGSMLLVGDDDYHAVEENFHEAVFTHASTSPNLQIIASLDVARRQMELEGSERDTVFLEMDVIIRVHDDPFPELIGPYLDHKVSDAPRFVDIQVSPLISKGQARLEEYNGILRTETPRFPGSNPV